MLTTTVAGTFYECGAIPAYFDGGNIAQNRAGFGCEIYTEYAYGPPPLNNGQFCRNYPPRHHLSRIRNEHLIQQQQQCHQNHYGES